MLLQPACDIAGNEKGNRNERFYRYGVAHCTCFFYLLRKELNYGLGQ